MRGFILRRLSLMAAVLFGLIVLVFVMSQVIPGDPARTAAGRNATAEQVEKVSHQLGLDQPLPMQFLSYFGRLFHGDLGTSMFTHRPIADDLMSVFPSSVELVVLAMIINILIALPLGVLSAVYRGSWIDGVTRLAATLGAAVPVFWLGLMIQQMLGAKLGWFPLIGQTSFGVEVPHRTGLLTVDALLAGDLHAFADIFGHLLLPAVTLAAAFIAVVARTTRSTMLGVLEQDYMVLARAKGVRGLRLMIGHGLRNAMVPSSTIIGMQLGWMLGSTVLVESIFGRTGIGSYAVTAVLQSDVYAVIAVVLLIGVVFVLVNFLVDLLHLWLDPRLRTASA